MSKCSYVLPNLYHASLLEIAGLLLCGISMDDAQSEGGLTACRRYAEHTDKARSYSEIRWIISHVLGEFIYWNSAAIPKSLMQHQSFSLHYGIVNTSGTLQNAHRRTIAEDHAKEFDTDSTVHMKLWRFYIANVKAVASILQEEELVYWAEGVCNGHRFAEEKQHRTYATYAPNFSGSFCRIVVVYTRIWKTTSSGADLSYKSGNAFAHWRFQAGRLSQFCPHIFGVL